MTQKTIDNLPDAERACVNLAKTYSKSNLVLGKATQEAIRVGETILESLKPKLTPVDMSVLIDSGIDCVFSPSSGFEKNIMISEVKEIVRDGHVRNDRRGYPYCKPRMNYWFSESNFTNATFLVEKLRNAGFSIETWSDRFGNIIEFRINGLKEGYCWPWEV